jgi:hypothetical protein
VTSPRVPLEALWAAEAALLNVVVENIPVNTKELARLVLEAAAPHMSHQPQKCTSESPNYGARCQLDQHDDKTVHEARRGDSLISWSANYSWAPGGGSVG